MFTSAGSHQASHDALFQRISFYRQPDRVRADVTFLLQNMHTLKPDVGQFTTGAGQSITLFYLYGTVAISYAGSTYNIPMTFYLDPPYPQAPPRCFVTPTSGMQIKSGHKHVDQQGMVYLPYLNQWNPHSSNMTELVAIVSSVFSADPPVYSGAPAPTQTGFTAQPAAQQPCRAETLRQSLTAKISGKLPKLLKEIVDDCNEQIRSQEALSAQAEKVFADVVSLERSQLSLTAFVGRLASMEADAQAVIEREGEGETDPLASLDADSLLGAQVLELLAEDAALDDWQMALDDALAAGKLEVEEFIKEVRDAAKKQFMARALLRKAAATLQAFHLQKSRSEMPPT